MEDKVERTPTTPLRMRTIRQAAAELGFPEFALRRLVKNGEIPSVGVGNRFYVDLGSIERYLREGNEVWRLG